ncbi:MAG TPA: DUF2723 domain-containing protein, partial [Chloroflexota bacterium]|nr:DUF2723 domain-containing protein [Chloroflexota bacterium]
MSALGHVTPAAVGIGAPARLTRASIGRRAVEAVWLASFAGVAVAVYAATLARDVTWQNGGGDGPELATAAYVWGVAHPPGYPLYLTVLRVAQLVPLGDIALRSNAFSAFSAVLAAVLLYATLRTLPTSRVAGNDWSGHVGASFGAAVFAFAPLVWSQAAVTEVYAFEAFLLSLFLLTLVRYWRAQSARRLLVAATTLGLLISHHPPFAVAAVILGWSAFVSSRSWQTCLMTTLVPLLIAVALFATVALRASFQPWLNWGEPTTFGDWFAHVTALSYRGYFLSATLSEDARRATYAAATLVRQGGWLATVLAAVGLGWLWQQSRPVAVACCSLAAFFVVFAVLYNARDSIVYLAPAVTVVALGAGLGATWLLRLLAPRAAVVLSIALLTSIAWQVRSGWPEVDVAHDRSAREWATQRLQDLPDGAVVHVQVDDQLFALWYLQGVEGLRPDVVVVDDRLLATPWF